MNKYLINPIRSAIKVAFRSLMTHKVRTSLTLIGIVIGISTVTIIVSAGEGLKGYIVGQVQSFGSNTIFVEARPPENTIVVTVITTLKAEEMEEIVDNDAAFPHVTRGYGYSATQAIARSRYEEITLDVTGTNADYIVVDSAEVEFGRFFTEKEEDSLRRVVVLGHEAAEDLFPVGGAIGQQVKMNNHTFTVIGVLKEKGPDLALNVDRMAFVPLGIVQKLFSGQDWIPYFAVQVDNEEYLMESKEQIERFLRRRHGIKKDGKDDFAALTSDEVVEIVDDVLFGVQILLFFLSLISLVVGGIGIMNIMYVTVTERIREIGIRKSVGAKSKDILFQFLMEAVIVTSFGGFVGAALGVGITYLIALYAQEYGFQWEYFISTNGIIIALVVAMACGIIFGLAPARRAAAQDPINALRYDQ